MSIFTLKEFWFGAIFLVVVYKVALFFFVKIKGRLSARHKVVKILWGTHAKVLRLALAVDFGVQVYDKVESNRIDHLAKDNAKNSVILSDMALIEK